MLFIPGQKVTYLPKKEHGVIKSISDEHHCFVVYHCEGKWEEANNYTAARTSNDDLANGWL